MVVHSEILKVGLKEFCKVVGLVDMKVDERAAATVDGLVGDLAVKKVLQKVGMLVDDWVLLMEVLLAVLKAWGSVEWKDFSLVEKKAEMKA